MRRRGAGVLAAILAAAGCRGSDRADLAVDLRTDLLPSHEFQAVRVELFPAAAAGGAPEQMRLAAVLDTYDYLAGVRVAELNDLAAGARALRVALLDGRGSVVAERLRRIDVGGDALVLVVIARDCRDVSCPIETECESEVDCPARAACAGARCVEGSCLVDPIPGACGADEYCDPDLGCRPIESPDAGMPDSGTSSGTDAGRIDAGRIDAGPPPPDCTGDSDCPSDTTGAWSECNWSGPCDESASRERDNIRWSCDGGECVATTNTERDTCVRDATGSSCSDGIWCNGEEYCLEGGCPGALTTPCGGAQCMSGCTESGGGSCIAAPDRSTCTYVDGFAMRTGTCMSGACCECGSLDLCTTLGGDPGCRGSVGTCNPC